MIYTSSMNFPELTKRFSLDLEVLQNFLNSVSIFFGSFLAASSSLLENFSMTLTQTSQSPGRSAAVKPARATTKNAKNSWIELFMIHGVIAKSSVCLKLLKQLTFGLLKNWWISTSFSLNTGRENDIYEIIENDVCWSEQFTSAQPRTSGRTVARIAQNLKF